MQKLELPTPLVRIATELYGRALSVHSMGSSGGNAIVALWTGAQACGVVKAYASSRPFRQELHAYRRWTDARADIPNLHAVHETRPLALFIEYLDGEPLSDMDLEPSVEAQVHLRAGAWLRGFHDTPFMDEDSVPLTEAYRTRLDGWLARCRSNTAFGSGSRRTRISVELEAWLGERLDRALLGMVDAARVPCHRDWEPRNWLVDPDGGFLAAIDFEHARADFALADLARLAAYVWPSRPDLRDAFWQGYGAPRTQGEHRTIEALAAFEAAQRWIWAAGHGDDALLQTAVGALEALGAPIR